MKRITIENRSAKKGGNVFLRFRVRDGRNVQLYYKSEIKANLADLDKFTEEGLVKPRCSVFNKLLADDISKTIRLIGDSYDIMVRSNLPLDSSTLVAQINKTLHPCELEPIKRDSLLRRLEKYRESGYRDGLFGKDRYKHYGTVLGKLTRFLTINGKSNMRPTDMTADLIMDFRDFLFNEYTYVQQHPKLYEGMDKRELPKAKRARNTVVTEMKMFQAFYAALEEMEEIIKSPFRKLGRERKKKVMSQKYNEPFFLRKDEFKSLLTAKVPTFLQETRDAFVLQCTFGFRISDFRKLTKDNIKVSPEGIPYIHYLPQKTKENQRDYSEVETPIIRLAYDIIQKTDLNFPVLRNQTGRTGYNAKIKALLQCCKIDRKISIFNENSQENEYVCLYSVAGSKLARSTHIDMMNKVQIDKYAAGLHKQGSIAVDHYTMLELKDRFKLMNIAFGQPDYRVDTNLKIIEVKEKKGY